MVAPEIDEKERVDGRISESARERENVRVSLPHRLDRWVRRLEGAHVDWRPAEAVWRRMAIEGRCGG